MGFLPKRRVFSVLPGDGRLWGVVGKPLFEAVLPGDERFLSWDGLISSGRVCFRFVWTGSVKIFEVPFLSLAVRDLKYCRNRLLLRVFGLVKPRMASIYALPQKPFCRGRFEILSKYVDSFQGSVARSPFVAGVSRLWFLRLQWFWLFTKVKPFFCFISKHRWNRSFRGAICLTFGFFGQVLAVKNLLQRGI